MDGKSKGNLKRTRHPAQLFLLLFVFTYPLSFDPSKTDPFVWGSSSHGPTRELGCATAPGCPEETKGVMEDTDSVPLFLRGK